MCCIDRLNPPGKRLFAGKGVDRPRYSRPHGYTAARCRHISERGLNAAVVNAFFQSAREKRRG